jgi:Zinc carboxypeptidase
VGRDFRLLYRAVDPAVRKKVASEDLWVGWVHDPKEVFRGDRLTAEPETTNIVTLIDTLKPSVFVDVHSFGPIVICPWSLETNQTTDPDQNFANPAFHGLRDATAGNVYAEYVPASIQKAHAARIAGAPAGGSVGAW